MANPFDNLRVTADNTRQSINWYNNQIKNLRNLETDVRKAVRGQRGQEFKIGGLYLFRYDPKHKDTLPYYDRMPLVMPFAPAAGGFLGLNLHYLPYGWRFKLMGLLLDEVNNPRDPKARAKVSWQILNQSSKFPGVSPCVKHYLLNHVQSGFLPIPNNQWLAAAMMPVEDFTGKTLSGVFADSRRNI
jgi:hypothetical protein